MAYKIHVISVAILRSAYCTGADGVIVTEKNSAPFNATVFKASAGLAEYLDIYIAASAELAAQELKKAGYTLYLASFAGENVPHVSIHHHCVWWLAREGFGISKQVYKYGTEITLPKRHLTFLIMCLLRRGFYSLLLQHSLKEFSYSKIH